MQSEVQCGRQVNNINPFYFENRPTNFDPAGQPLLSLIWQHVENEPIDRSKEAQYFVQAAFKMYLSWWMSIISLRLLNLLIKVPLKDYIKVFNLRILNLFKGNLESIQSMPIDPLS